MKKLTGLAVMLVSLNCYAGTPVFSVTPNVTGQAQLVQGQQGTYIYQITNNTQFNLTNIGLHQVPPGVTTVANAGYQYCNFPLSLNSHSSCLMKVNVNSNQSPTDVDGGPQICFTPSKPVYCSQPLNVNQFATHILPGPISSSCANNINNFNYELTQTFDSTTIDPMTIESWGPARNQLLLSSSNPNLTGCVTTDINNTTNISWMRQRLLAAENFWIGQKLNYCHHHVPDFATPAISNGTPRAQIAVKDGGYCSNAVNIMPGSRYYGQPVRWNYSGTGSETQQNWINNNYMWYGVDCSDFTSFAYNFSFGFQFNSDTGYQAGQATGGAQDNLLPNTQTAGDTLQIPTYVSPTTDPAGVLVCKDGTVETRSGLATDYCGSGPGGPVPSNNGYFSVFLNAQPATTDPTFPVPTPSNVTANMLNLLKPGDLIFLGFHPGSSSGSGNNPSSVVTHVVTWTGKKVGYGANDINPSQIAPESICPNNWQPQIGDWVIIDSHYQGPDYRVFTNCFYQNNIWGVRRVIGYMYAT